VYNSSSPDELALVNAAKYLGMNFIQRDEKSNIIIKKRNDELTKYTLLELIEFTSERQRMSTLIKYPDGKIKLLVKGSDNMIT
jgi:magnesium-transporting ATPase (P-type)